MFYLTKNSGKYFRINQKIILFNSAMFEDRNNHGFQSLNKVYVIENSDVILSI